MRFGDLTYREIRERAEAGWIAVVPTGCTEQQGPHLPVDFDTWFAETACLAAARQAAEKHGVKVLVLPAMPFGPTPEHRSFGSGYILEFARYSSTGVIGDPTHASTELGARLWQAVVEDVALTFKEIAESKLA